MYIPKINLTTNREEIVAFMKQYSFATIITAKNGFPVATHLPFNVSTRDDTVILASHFAKANEHWKEIETNQVLVIFSEPHAYISTQNYNQKLNVPTWNYISVHAYGEGKLVTDTDKAFEVLEGMIDTYEATYKNEWSSFPEKYKLRMSKGIVAFEVIVSDLQGKKKLSQNRSESEREKIIDSLSKTEDSTARAIADYMKHEK